jgi:hypothetical protein
MFQVPSALPRRHFSRTLAGIFAAFTSLARLRITPLIGLSQRFQTEIAGNQSSGETSIAIRSACAAKHFAFVTRHGSPAARPD